MATVEVISHTKLGSAQKSFTVSSIPATYDHLYIVGSLQSDRSNAIDSCNIKLNASASGYAKQSLESVHGGPDAAHTSSAAQTEHRYLIAATNGGYDSGAGFSSLEVWIPNYADTNFQQNYLVELSLQGNTTTNYEWWQSQDACMWDTSAAIHTFYVEADVGDFNTNSCLTVYGINGV
tara:strand:- start:708 stop:1241 length:534 start_codon:yes stop_codon:yes gene_type:complete